MHTCITLRMALPMPPPLLAVAPRCCLRRRPPMISDSTEASGTDALADARQVRGARLAERRVGDEGSWLYSSKVEQVVLGTVCSKIDAV